MPTTRSQSYPGREEESRLQPAKALTPLYDSKRLALSLSDDKGVYAFVPISRTILAQPSRADAKSFAVGLMKSKNEIR